MNTQKYWNEKAGICLTVKLYRVKYIFLYYRINEIIRYYRINEIIRQKHVVCHIIDSSHHEGKRQFQR